MPQRVCPICKKAFSYRTVRSHRTYPFCGAKCAAIDLGDWLTERYGVEVEPNATDVAEIEDALERRRQELESGGEGEDTSDDDDDHNGDQ